MLGFVDLQRRGDGEFKPVSKVSDPPLTPPWWSVSTSGDVSGGSKTLLYVQVNGRGPSGLLTWVVEMDVLRSCLGPLHGEIYRTNHRSFTVNGIVGPLRVTGRTYSVLVDTGLLNEARVRGVGYVGSGVSDLVL